MKEMHALEEAIEKGYLAHKTNRNLSDTYYDWCKSHELPFIRFILKRTQATLFVDMLPTTDKSGHARRMSHLQLDQIKCVCERWSVQGEGRLLGGELSINVDGILTRNVELLGAALTTILMIPTLGVPN